MKDDRCTTVQNPGAAANYIEEAHARVFAVLAELPRQGCFTLADHARIREAPPSMSRKRRQGIPNRGK
jgi:hypothetical protein